MSTRALRRILGTQDQILARNAPPGDEQEEVIERGSGFSFSKLAEILNSKESGDEDEGRVEEKNEENDPENVKSDQGVQKPVKKTRRGRKKKTKAKKTKEEEEEAAAWPEENGEEIPSTTTDSRSNASVKPPTSVLSVEARFLNADRELDTLFGRIDPHYSRSSLRDTRAHSRRIAMRGKKLVNPKDVMPFKNPGLSMEMVGTGEEGIKIFRFRHSPAYQRIQFRFWDAAHLNDHDEIMELLKESPFHVDSLLQVADIARAGEEHNVTRSLIDRALYTFQNVFNLNFNYSLGLCRLDYAQQENRSFFFTIFKHIQLLYHRGCPRTALEFAKLLFSLSPEDDPLAVLAIIDYLCIRSQQYEYLEKLFECLEYSKSLWLMPNFCFSMALARFRKDGGENDANNTMLQEALLKFPNVLEPLLEKCQIESDSKSASCKFFHGRHRDGEGLTYLTALYVARSHIFWKDEDALHWLERNVLAVIDRLESDETAKNLASDFETRRSKQFSKVPRNMLRHVVLSDPNEIRLSLPAEYTEPAIYQYDPFPPADSRCGYERPPRQSTGRVPEHHAWPRVFFESLFPGFNQGENGRQDEPVHFWRALDRVRNQNFVDEDPQLLDDSDPDRDVDEWQNEFD